MKKYFDPAVSDSEVKEIFPSLMMTGNRIVGADARRKILGDFHYDASRIVKYPFKPFDSRWCYLENLRPLFSEPSPELLLQRRVDQNVFFITRDTADKDPEGTPFFFSSTVCDYDSISGHARHFPTRLKIASKKASDSSQVRLTAPVSKTVANLSFTARKYLLTLGVVDPDSDAEAASLLWRHALAIGYSRQYLEENLEGIRDDWPRMPLPLSKEALVRSAEIGRSVAALLDADIPIERVTIGKLRPELSTIAAISRESGGSLNPDAGDLEITAGWGHGGKGGAVMPGKGRLIERDYTAKEREAIAAGATALGLSDKEALKLMGERTLDVYLNNLAYWKNIPLRVWDYTIGGYQVIKKWLSYREREILGRAIKMDEARAVTDIARRIAAILVTEPELDANYMMVKKAAYDWSPVTQTEVS